MAIDKILRTEGASITWTCKQISKMIEKNTIGFTNEVQRAFTWERHRMSELIWSIIMNRPIPPIFTERGVSPDNDKIKYYDCLDGRQRCTTIYKFLNDEFALTKLKSIPYLNENGEECTIDITGKKFSELDEELQDIIKDATITVKYFDNLEQPVKADIFRRLNNGKPLSAKARTLASSKEIKKLLDIGSHELFNKMLTDKARANKNQAVIVVKAWTMLNKDIEDISFASKHFNPMIENVDISDVEKLNLVKVFDYVIGVHDELIDNKEKDVAKKILTEIHLISLIPFFSEALDNGISEAMMSEWLINFFKTENDTEEYDEYLNASMSGVARNASIIARHNALNKSYKNFFKVDMENSENTLTTA